MARQKGIIKIDGTLGDITFYKSADGYLARENAPVSAERIATDPAFQRTRENMAEFGHAGRAGKLLRNAIRTLLQNAQDYRVSSRLTRQMMEVIKADTTSIRGRRNVLDGETELLEGFDFNANAKLSTTLFAPYTAAINRTTGNLSVAIPSFVPAERIGAPEGTTHFKIVSAGSEVDFETETFTTGLHDSGLLPWNTTPTAAINLAHTLPANSGHPLFLLLGIQFFQQVNGTDYPLKNGAFNTLSLVKVSGL